MKKIRQLLGDVRKILNKDWLSFSQRVALAFSYIRIRSNRRRGGRALEHLEKVKVAGFTVYYDDFEDFYWTFREVFIEEGYYFKSSVKDPKIIDCGGNIGVSMLYFKCLYPEARITIFEPLSQNIALLKKNIEHNKLEGIKLIEKAVSDSVGIKELYGSGRASTLSPEMSKRNVKDINQSVNRIETTLLSEYIKSDDVTYCKIDIEGAEGAVMRDLAQSGTLDNVKQYGVEFHYDGSERNRLSEIIKYFEEYGYRITFPSHTDATRIVERDYTHIMINAVKDNIK